MNDNLLSGVEAPDEEGDFDVELSTALLDEGSALDADLGTGDAATSEAAVPDGGLASVVLLDPKVESPGGGTDHIAGDDLEGLADMGGSEDTLLERGGILIDAADGDGDGVGDIDTDGGADALAQVFDICKCD